MGGKTIAEKILSRKSGQDARAGDLVVAEVDAIMVHDGNRPHPADVFADMGGTRLPHPERVVLVLDHQPSPNESVANLHAFMRSFAAEQGCTLYEIGEGNCHQLMVENGHVLPGELAVGSDSHTITYGGMGVLSAGYGTSDVAAAMLTGQLWFRVPESIRLVLHGRLAPGVYAKDLVLHLIKRLRASGATYRSVEFSGPAVEALAMDSRFTLANMAMEMGAKFGLVDVDATTEAWARPRAARPFTGPRADPDAVYEQVIEQDVSLVEPQIAAPHTVDNVVPVGEVLGVPIHEAVLATCANGRLEDLRVAAEILRGRHIAPGVRLLVSPLSRSVMLQAMAEGVLATLVAAGATLGIPSCAGCTASPHVFIPADGENVISAANRNFRGRLGNRNANLYLASPAAVAAAALEGRIVDPRQYAPSRTPSEV